MVFSLKKSITVSTVLFGTILGTLCGNANASEKVTVQYGILGETVPISELEELSQTGEASGALKDILDSANEDPAEAQKILNEEVSINMTTLYKILNTKPGEFVLSQLAEVFHIDDYVAGIPALRAAFVNSAAPDNKVSLLEVFQNYPTETMYVNGAQLAKDIETFNRLLSEAKNVISNFQCNCVVAQEETDNPLLAAYSDNAGSVTKKCIR